MNASIYCPHCHKHTALSVARAPYRTDYGAKGQTDALWRKSENEVWWIGICNSCHYPSLVLNDGFRVYPFPLPNPSDKRIPDAIRSDLDEAKMCFATGCHRACAVTARRAVQRACNEKGATQDTLMKQIEHLCNTGVITTAGKDWVTAVRHIGNDGAHPKDTEVSEMDAKATLDLAEQFLHILFVTPAIAQESLAARGM